jgi:hypothetical protein
MYLIRPQTYTFRSTQQSQVSSSSGRKSGIEAEGMNHGPALWIMLNQLRWVEPPIVLWYPQSTVER